MDKIEDWAKIAAYDEVWSNVPSAINTDNDKVSYVSASPVFMALARRIQRDDKPPVDPLLLEARKLAGIFHRSQRNKTCAERVESGNHDHWDSVQAAYKYLKEKQNG